MDWRIYFLQGLELLFLGLGTYFDLKERNIPLVHLGVFAVLGMLVRVCWGCQDVKRVLAGILIGLFFLLIGWITKEAIGYGDGLGLMVLGIYEDFRGMLSILFGAFLLSGLYGLLRLVVFREPRDREIPFYPFILCSFLGVILR